MAEPYLLIAYWRGQSPDYGMLTRGLFGNLDLDDASVHVAHSGATHSFADISTASAFLTGSKDRIDGFSIHLAGGVSVTTTTWGKSVSRIEIEVSTPDYGHDPEKKKDKVYADLRAIGTALIAGSGARFVWFTRIPADIDGVSTTADGFDDGLAKTDARTPLLFDELDYTGWLFLWPAGSNGLTISTKANVISDGKVNFVEHRGDRPFDLVAGWEKTADL
jgi:hypothetical protein